MEKCSSSVLGKLSLLQIRICGHSRSFPCIHRRECCLIDVVLATFRSGRVVETYELPTPLTALPTIGGPNHDILFVPTASLNVNFVTGVIGGKLDGDAGSLFMITGIAPGRPERLPSALQ